MSDKTCAIFSCGAKATAEVDIDMSVCDVHKAVFFGKVKNPESGEILADYDKSRKQDTSDEIHI